MTRRPALVTALARALAELHTAYSLTSADESDLRAQIRGARRDVVDALSLANLSTPDPEHLS